MPCGNIIQQIAALPPAIGGPLQDAAAALTTLGTPSAPLVPEALPAGGVGSPIPPEFPFGGVGTALIPPALAGGSGAPAPAAGIGGAPAPAAGIGGLPAPAA
ncbi:MAG: hypothetical protein K2Q25_09670, partial [Mycobacteriaceae bacterium]|nr:hypothetical protein [Mycobacteriaceae bacterium]